MAPDNDHQVSSPCVSAIRWFVVGGLFGAALSTSLLAALFLLPTAPFAPATHVAESSDPELTGDDAVAALNEGRHAQAYELLNRLSDDGDPEAQQMLGQMYERGQGVARSYPKAYRWYRAAAEQDAPEAMQALARFYAYGYGVERSTAAAARWSSRAQAQVNEARAGGHTDDEAVTE